jgi:hypothetical protein
MNIKSKRTASSLSIAFAVAFLFIACEEGPAGIFSSVSSETKTNTDISTDDIKTSSPSFVARLGTTWYAGIGTLWSKTGEAKWTKVDLSAVNLVLSSDKSIVYASAGAVINVAGASTLFVAFSDSASGDDLGVWKTTAGTIWEDASLGLPATQYMRKLLAANGILFAVTSTVTGTGTDVSEAYSLYYFDGSQFQATAVTENLAIGMPDSVAFDGSSYWFTAGGKLIKGTGVSTLAVVTGPKDWTADSTAVAPLTATYGGICAIGTSVIISTRTGKLHFSSDGTTWTSSTDPYANSGGDAYSLSQPTYLEAGAYKILVIGTNGKVNSDGNQPPLGGYLEFDLSAGFAADLASDSTHSLTSDATKFDTSLAGKAVSIMPAFDTANGTFKIFALTSGAGLWSNTYNGSDWGLWVRE